MHFNISVIYILTYRFFVWNIFFRFRIFRETSGVGGVGVVQNFLETLKKTVQI